MITLKDFIKQEIRQLREFEAFWEHHSLFYPELYFKEETPGEWQEQYFIWIDLYG